MGNLRSVAKALEVAGAQVVVTADAAEVAASDGLCVPGQGIFGRCMTNLGRTHMDQLIREWTDRQKPYLGICLGMQVLFDSSEEGGGYQGLGLLEGKVTRLPDSVRVPHIGWNSVGDDYFYFDHSYAAHPDDGAMVTGWCEHGDRFAAEIRTGSVLGVQFHPEKSAAAGLALLGEWVKAA
jgi:imidazole glycerol-phosphate synthase subunit HisH